MITEVTKPDRGYYVTELQYYCTTHVGLDVTGLLALVLLTNGGSRSKAMGKGCVVAKLDQQHEKNRVVMPNIYSQRLQKMSLFSSLPTI